MKLRDYQIENIDAAREALRGHQRVILCLPTGAGKTVIMCYISQSAVSKGLKVLVLTNRTQLMKQARNTFGAFGLSPYVVNDSKAKIISSNLIVGTVQTLKRRIKPKVDLIIVDEAHLQDFDKFLTDETYENTKVIGLTATPERLTKTNTLSKIYSEIIQITSIQDLIDNGALVKARYYGVETEQLSDADINRSTGDFDDKKMFGVFDKTKLYGDVIDFYKSKCLDKKVIVFNINVEHSIKTRDMFIAAGIPAVHIDGNMPQAERDALLEPFTRGEVKVLCNCKLYTFGFDDPRIEGVFVNMQTKSTPLWLQMCGRGSRPYPGKEYFTIVDFGNHVRNPKIGPWHMPRTWSLQPAKEKKGGVGMPPPMKQCPRCSLFSLASTKVCEECGYVYKNVDDLDKTRKGAIVEITDSDLMDDSDEIRLVVKTAIEKHKNNRKELLEFLRKASYNEQTGKFSKMKASKLLAEFRVQMSQEGYNFHPYYTHKVFQAWHKARKP